MGVITFNGHTSAEVGLEVETFPDFDMAQKEYDVIHVPGRNGDIIIDKKTFKNVARKYKVNVAAGSSGLDKTISAVVSWLYSASGYARLEDTYEPDYYRMAMCDNLGTFQNLFHKAGTATLSFDCKPQRYLKSGEAAVSFTASGTIVNPTAFESSPLIKVYLTNRQSASGEIVIGNHTFTIQASEDTSSDEYVIDVDCELQEAMHGLHNENSRVIFGNGKAPRIAPGENAVEFSTSTISKIEIIPRWWTI